MTQEQLFSISDALKQDAGRAVIKIPSKILHELLLNPGDVVEILGKRKEKAVATVERAAIEDENKDFVRIDSITRDNAQVSLNDKIGLQKITCANATSVTLAPTQRIQFNGNPTPYFKQQILNKPLLKKQQVMINLMGNHLRFVVTKTEPSTCVKITSDTKLELSNRIESIDQKIITNIHYEDIGGLKNEIEQIREMIEIPMNHPEVFKHLGISAPKGLLLTGPPGTGKTLLAKAVASETDAEFYSIAGPEIVSGVQGQSEKKLRDIFTKAGENAPAIIFIDEIDSIAPKRGEGHDPQSKRIVAQLLTLMDGLKSRGDVVIMAATNRPNDIDEALRRPGRFDREIRIMPPDREGRLEILQIHTRGMPLSQDVDLDNITERTIGYTGADIEVLCKEAAIKALKPYMKDLKEYSDELPMSVLEQIEVTMQNFREALQLVEPSAMREVMIQKPNVKWDDIGGLTEAKNALRDAIELPLNRPDLFKKAGVKPPKGILLFGPPGTGKTLIAKAVATEANANFISVKGPELVSKWVGESEKHIREIFKRARMVAPTVIFFDEFDSITKVRGQSMTDSTERMVNQLLTEIDGIENLEGVTIIAATNRPDLIDPALLRSGRIEWQIEIGLPDEESRRKIFAVHTQGMPIIDVNIERYIEETSHWSGADIESLCRNAGMNAIRRSATSGEELRITQQDFGEAFKECSKKKEQKDKSALHYVG